MLAALVPAYMKAEITLVDEGVRKFDHAHGTYDVVGISIVTSSAGRGYELADYYRTRGSYVLLGGHHATLLPAEALLHADSVFTGSAEVTLPEFFADYCAGSPKPVYRSEGFRADCVPVPRRDLMQKKGYLKQPTILADYGCGNACTYCVIHSFWGKNAKRPVAHVIDEIRTLGAKEFLFLDPSPISDKEYAKELYAGLAKLHITWAGLSTLDVTDDEELLDLLARSGCVGTLLGFESFHEDDLKSLSKYKNKVEDYKRVVSKLHDKGIVVLGTFMLGLDQDTVESIRAMPDLIEDTQIDIPRFAILTPFPNTPYYAQMEGENRILTRDWSRYDSIHCVFKPKKMTPEELETEFISLWKESYSLRRIGRRLRYTPRRKGTTLITNIGFSIYAKRIEKMMRVSL